MDNSPIDNFHTKGFEFLSNFYPVVVVFDGVQYATVEHAYMAAKTIVPEEREQIQACKTPGAAKRIGRKITLREDWDKIKIDVMRSLLEQKFAESTELRERLDSTKSCELIEGNTWGDKFWGVCKGEGRNELGKLLMQIRDGLF